MITSSLVKFYQEIDNDSFGPKNINLLYIKLIVGTCILYWALDYEDERQATASQYKPFIILTGAK